MGFGGVCSNIEDRFDVCIGTTGVGIGILPWFTDWDGQIEGMIPRDIKRHNRRPSSTGIMGIEEKMGDAKLEAKQVSGVVPALRKPRRTFEEGVSEKSSFSKNE